MGLRRLAEATVGAHPTAVATLVAAIASGLLFGAVIAESSPAFATSYASHFEPGTYACARCGGALFSSRDKFRSTTRWPSFRRAVAESVATRADRSYGLDRVEALCARCGAHLGHVFPDGRLAGDDHPEARDRYCILSSSLRFVPEVGAPPKPT